MGGVLLGAVAYDPKVVTIWDGFRALAAGRGRPRVRLRPVLELRAAGVGPGRRPDRRGLELAAGVGPRPPPGGGPRGVADPGHHARHRLRPAVGRGGAGRLAGALRWPTWRAGWWRPERWTRRRPPCCRCRCCGRPGSPRDRRGGQAVRHRRRAARRPHRRGAGGGPRAVRRRPGRAGGRGLHDRLQPAAVRAGGGAAGRRGAGARADAAVRPLHDDRRPSSADAGTPSRRAIRRAAARHGLRRRRRCGRCSTWRGSRNGGRRAFPATTSWSGPSTRPGSTTATARSPPHGYRP